MDNEFDDLLARFRDLTERRKELESQAESLSREAFALEQRLVEQFAATGTQKLTRDGRTFFLRGEVSIGIQQGMQAEAIEACKAAGIDDMLSVQPARFKSWAKEYVSDEHGNPPENDDEFVAKLPEAFRPLVKVFSQKRLRMLAS